MFKVCRYQNDDDRRSWGTWCDGLSLSGEETVEDVKALRTSICVLHFLRRNEKPTGWLLSTWGRIILEASPPVDFNWLHR